MEIAVSCHMESPPTFPFALHDTAQEWDSLIKLSPVPITGVQRKICVWTVCPNELHTTAPFVRVQFLLDSILDDSSKVKQYSPFCPIPVIFL